MTRLNALNPGVADIDWKHGVTGSAAELVVTLHATGVTHQLAATLGVFNAEQFGMYSKCVGTEWMSDGVCGLSVQLLNTG